MTVFGGPEEWVDLIETMVPDILELVLSAWGDMAPLADDALENPTTDALCRCLRQSRNAGNLPFRIDIQMAELDPAAGQDQGRIDIAFSPMVPHENIYFALECKRLNVLNDGSVRSYASEYVTHGMLRFIRGQYAAIVREGGMLAYVLDRSIETAVANVLRVMQSRHTELGMEPPGEFRTSSVRAHDSRCKETHHQREHDASRFAIHHMFVAGN